MLALSSLQALWARSCPVDQAVRLLDPKDPNPQRLPGKEEQPRAPDSLPSAHTLGVVQLFPENLPGIARFRNWCRRPAGTARASWEALVRGACRGALGVFWSLGLEEQVLWSFLEAQVAWQEVAQGAWVAALGHGGCRCSCNQLAHFPRGTCG